MTRICLLVALLASCGDGDESRRILFIRGGSGTGGFVEGSTDDHLCDINDYATAPYNRGYGQLATLLRADGFIVEQVIEGPATAPAQVDLEALNLSRYAVIVFGSNNATYTAEDATLVTNYIRDGGGALFSSDGNWGTFWDKAPSSDQTFLTQFGLTMNQDGGPLLSMSGTDFLEPGHPILLGVDAFEGEGTSPCSLSHDPTALATPRQIVGHKGAVRRNTAPEGPVEQAVADDAALTVVEYARGRIACHFDRNTFFNENGAGTSLASASNATYARNLFRWLARRD